MDDFDTVAWCYDCIPVPTHAKALRRALVGTDGVVVDLGGGTGKYTVRFLDARHRGIVVDASRKMLVKARRKRGLPAVVADAAWLPFADGSIDAITCTEAFHHFGDAQAHVLDEARRVLRPDGSLLIEEPDPTRFAGRWMARFEHLQGMESRFHPPARLAAMLAERFEHVDQTRSGRFTVLSRAKRPRP